MRIVITTVGTSLFINYFKNKDSIRDALKRNFENFDKHDYTRLENLKKNGCASNKIELDILERIIKKYWIYGFRKCGDGTWNAENSDYLNEDCCAEIKSIMKILKEVNDDLKIYLIATDTALSYLAAGIISTGMKNKKIRFCSLNGDDTDVCCINGLVIDDPREFEKKGFPGLIETFLKIKWKEKNSNIITEYIFNISGGYKALIPFMTIMGQLYDIPVYYIYENSDRLIKIPQMPMQFDWSFAEIYYPYLCTPSVYSKNSKAVNELIKHNLLYYEKGNYELTALGILYKEYIMNEMPQSSSVFGFFVEYKLYEYYMENPYKGLYPYVRRGVEKIKADKGTGDIRLGSEIDLVLYKNKNYDGDFIIVEIKSFLQIYKVEYFSKTKEQISKQVKNFIEKKKIPCEFHLVIYSYVENSIRKLNENLKIVEKNIVDGFNGKCTFKVFHLYIPLDGNVSKGFKQNMANPYQNFMKNKINDNTSQKIFCEYNMRS